MGLRTYPARTLHCNVARLMTAAIPEGPPQGFSPNAGRPFGSAGRGLRFRKLSAKEVKRDVRVEQARHSHSARIRR
jgi:hypothetical protein